MFLVKFRYPCIFQRCDELFQVVKGMPPEALARVHAYEISSLTHNEYIAVQYRGLQEGVKYFYRSFPFVFYVSGCFEAVDI